MSSRYGRYKLTAGRLILAIILAAGLLAALGAWRTWSSFNQVLSKSYPEARAQQSEGAKHDQQTSERASWVDGRQTWYAGAALDVAFFQLLLGIVGVVGVGYTVFYTRQASIEAERSARLAVEAFSADTEPMLSVHMNPPVVKWENQRFVRDGKPVDGHGDDLFFVIRNSGKSPVVVVGLYRRWTNPPSGTPDAINYPNQPTPGVFKPNRVVIGPGGDSFIIRAAILHLYNLPNVADIGNPTLDGYVISRDVRGDYYVTNYCLTYLGVSSSWLGQAKQGWAIAAIAS